jgi:hypothetical protein
VHPTINGFAGWSGGEVRLQPTDEYDSTDPLVIERPELFGLDLDSAVDRYMTANEEPSAPRRGRPPGSKNKPKDDAGA